MDPVAIPNAAQPQLRALYSRYLTAKAAFYLYLEGVTAGMELPQDIDWDINTETMLLIPYLKKQDMEAVNGLQSKR